MPWDRAGARRHTKKANTAAKQSRWSSIANSVLKQTGDEGRAIRIANSRMADGGYLKQKVGNRDTQHGKLDLPVVLGGPMKKPKMRYAFGGLLEKRRMIAAGEAEAKAMGRGETTVKPAPTPPETARDKKIREAEEAATKAKGGWIKGAIKNPGALHRQLGVPQGQKIPSATLHAAAQKGGTLGRRARLAETLKKLRHSGGGTVRFAKGGTVRCGDGCAIKGRTKGRMV